MPNSSTTLSETSDMKDEKDSFYIPLVDLSIFDEDNIIIDPHSLELLKAGEVEQRYAVVGFVEDNKLYLYFRPSFSEEDKPKTDSEGKPITEAEAEEIFLKKVPHAKNFSAKDRIFAPSDQPGVVHKETCQSIYMQNLENLSSVDMPGITSDIQMGLSFYKKSNDLNLLDWLSRSTKNCTIFSVDPLAKMCFFFHEKQTDFNRPNYTNAYHLIRTLEPKAFEKIILAVRKKVLMVKDSKELKEMHDNLLTQIKKNTDYCIPKGWKRIRKDKNLIAKYLMRTIYYASGMEDEPGGLQLDNSKVIISVIEMAKEYKIPLNLNHIPSETEEENQDTSLVNACRMGDYESVKTLINYDNKKEIIDYPNRYGETPILIAVKNGHLNIAHLLLEKGAEARPDLKEAIQHNDIKKAQKIEKKYPLPERRRFKMIRKLRRKLDRMIEWDEIKLFIEKNIAKYGFEKMYLEENSKEIKDLKISLSNYIIAISQSNVLEFKEIEKIFSKDFFTRILNFYHPDIDQVILIAVIESSQSSPEERASMISWLLEKNVDTCLRDSAMQTALMCAVSRYDLETIQKILAHSTASLNLVDENSHSALMYAVIFPNITIFNYLLEAKATFDPNQILPFAAKHDNHFVSEIMKSLIIAVVKQQTTDLPQQLSSFIHETLTAVNEEQKINKDNIIDSYNKVLALVKKYEKENSFIKDKDREKSGLQTFGLLQSTQVSLESTKNTDLSSTTDLNSTSASRPK